MSHHVKIVGILTARPGKLEPLRQLLFDMAPHCRAEPGNLRWDIWRDQSEPGRFVIDELYRDDAGAAAHRETAHYKHYRTVINDLAERMAFILDPALVV